MAAANTKTAIAVTVVAILGMLGVIVALISGGDDLDQQISSIAFMPASPGKGPSPLPIRVAVPTKPPDPFDYNPAGYTPGGSVPVLEKEGDRPRRLFAAIQAELVYQANGSARVEAPGMTRIVAGDWLRYSNVEFEEEPTEFVARVGAEAAGSVMEARLDSPSGPVVSRLAVAPAGQKVTTQRAEIRQPAKGKHDVYLTFSGSPSMVRLDWFKFIRTPRDAFARMEAESYDDIEGIRDYGTAVGSLTPGDFLRYKRLDFKDGPSWFHACVGTKPEFQGSRIQVRLDSVTGPIVSELTVRSTGTFTNFKVQSAPVSGAQGIHDVYLTFTPKDKVGDMDWFCFSREQSLPAQAR